MIPLVARSKIIHCHCSTCSSSQLAATCAQLIFCCSPPLPLRLLEVRCPAGFTEEFIGQSLIVTNQPALLRIGHQRPPLILRKQEVTRVIAQRDINLTFQCTGNISGLNALIRVRAVQDHADFVLLYANVFEDHEGCLAVTQRTDLRRRHQEDFVRQAQRFEYAFLPFPLDGNQGLAVGTATAWRVNNAASAEQQAAGKVFLDWLITSDEGQTWSADTLKFIPAYADVKAPAGGLSESVAEYVTAGQTVPWAYNTVFPAGIDIDGAAYMQEYYAGRLSSAELIEELTLTWQDLAG
ncbi:MAG: extracellular solute-binding protein [Clostridia bacterium]|nr:extracellular solute-binding protein [Clostridia bacterium]